MRPFYGRVLVRDLVLFALVALLAVTLIGLAWRAVGAGQGLREAFAERNALLGTMGDLKFRAAHMRITQLRYALEADAGVVATDAQASSHAQFLREAEALGRMVNARLAERLSPGERAALEDLHAQLQDQLKADTRLDGALRVADPVARPRELTEAVAATGQAADATIATIDRLVDTTMKEDEERGDSLYARARRLRTLVTGAVVCGAALAAVLLASWAAAMRRYARMSRRIEHFALTDELTGLPNHRAWSERLTAEIARAIRQGSTLSLALLEVEEGTAGSGERARGGDLRTVAKAWKSVLRRDDYLARLQEGEFAFILPACDAAQAAAMAERMHALVPAAQRFAAGVADWDRREAADQLSSRVQAALRRAKSAGASPAVVVAESSSPASEGPVRRPDRPGGGSPESAGR